MKNTKIHGSKRGASADSPSEIPLKGWKDILLRVKNQLGIDHVKIVSAGVAFYFFLSLFPIISVLISVYGLITDPVEVENQLAGALGSLPTDAADMVKNIIKDTLSKSDSTLGFSLLISILLSLWSANSGTSSLFEGINIAYDEVDDRGFFKRTGITLAFTFGIILMGVLTIFLMAGFSSWIQGFDSELLKTVVTLLRWPLLAILISVGLALLYKVAADRDDPEFKWVSWGSAIATLLWVAGTWAFSFYIENFAGYTETYGNLAAVVILLLWLFLTSFIILLGAEINSEMEHQTAEDTTVGTDEPMGQRDAYHADHVAAGETKAESEEQNSRGDVNN
ncbi:MAG: YihY/virulence factor BrkB family protein [Cyclobacteriaceae bacterium]